MDVRVNETTPMSITLSWIPPKNISKFNILLENLNEEEPTLNKIIDKNEWFNQENGYEYIALL